jgi:hypothetical protein
MTRTILVLAIALCGGLTATVAIAQSDSVGSVSQLKGTASGEKGGTIEPLDLGTSVFMDEVLATGTASRLAIAFVDETQLTLGEKAKVRVDRFVYGGGHTQMIKVAAVGALRFISARTKPAGTQVVVATPVAEIGIRGTDFWTGPIDGQFGVLLLEGAVIVSNPAGTVELDQPGEGTNIAGPGAAPGPVTQWPQQKVDRALAAVAF